MAGGGRATLGAKVYSIKRIIWLGHNNGSNMISGQPMPEWTSS
ncbi:hypothetical protein CES86_4111 [Brucella lupini]|uniref:Uncharacterized protein n=1 Tax=Brucella lupini TaxID=255457 RepID=A0A256GFY1_9HYPH|nr:hypothetical protein CES86_4111 [Brucella lupini]